MLIATFACKKDSSIGVDILPKEDLLNASYFDTSTIYCYTVIEDSLRTDELATDAYYNVYHTNYNLLGSYIDPVFGRSDASVYTNFVMPNNIVGAGFGANPKLDSVVLSFTYSSSSGYYGDVTNALKFNVYKLNESLSYDSIYYSSHITRYEPSDLTYTGQGITIAPNLTKNVSVFDVTYKPQLRLRLNNEIGQFFIDDTTRIASTSALQKAFYGLYITTKNTSLSNGQGNILYLNMIDPQSKLTIYYHNGTDLTSKAFDLSISSGATRYNHFKHDYSTADDTLKKQIFPVNDSSYGKYNVFVQGMAGVKTKIEIPYLSHLGDKGPIAINKAQISLKVNNNPYFTDINKFTLPPQLILDGINENNETVPLAELGDRYSYSGTYDPISGEYQFNIPYTVQQIVSKKYKNFRFYLRIFMHQANPSRIVIGGSKSASYPLQLRLWYTKLY